MEAGETKIIESSRRHQPSRIGRLLARALSALGLIAIGAAGAILFLRFVSNTPLDRLTAAPTPTVAEAPSMAEPTAVETTDEVEVWLSAEAMAQAGIKTAKVAVAETSLSTQVPGVVTANAYREVKVVPIVGGIVTRVHVELGAAVRRGVPIATLFSAELAEAQTKYLSMQAMVKADDKRLVRTQQLVEIGAASRQELEEADAVHAGHATELEAARQRLFLLGLARKQVESLRQPSQIVSEILVPAPIDGVITARSTNLGQVVSVGEELFVVTDLSEVWVVGDLYEQDFQHVRVGSAATLLTLAYPDLALRGHVTYIDPRVDPQTRTAKVRVEIPNPDGLLRLGMYVTLSFTTHRGQRVVVVPHAALQTIGGRQVVFVAVQEEEGKFVQRTVQLGQLAGDFYVVLSGLEPGEVVATEGSFFLRAESLRNAPSG
ncbi:MAG TPA: efflux RND transporter periplasmic adaptor subunit [Candidatus Tectomicrobia bacterium]|nr:efflux RND transporter periplasmic adaptor subunit [Candidatus Tectomicrobia bacterium]